MLKKEEVKSRITNLVNLSNGSLGKYYRNYRLYTGNPTADLNTLNPSSVGIMPTNYSANLRDDTPRLNIAKSCVDTVVSKITQARCRPFINTANGSFKDIQIAKNLQTFLDIYCDEQRFNYKVATAFRDACIFDVGYLYFDPMLVEWLRVYPWNVYLDPSEVSGNGSKLTQAFFHFPHYPTNQLSDDIYKLCKDKGKPNQEYGIYYDTKSKTKAISIGKDIVEISEGFEEIPLVSLYYTEPIIGNAPMSIIDMIAGIQEQVDILTRKICEASRLSVAGTYFIPKSLSVSTALLNNRIGNVIPIQSANDTIQEFNPPFINQQYSVLLNEYIERAYNMVGVSQISAQGKKQAGLDSGVALATMEDIQSDRFETQLRQYVDTFTKMTKIMIQVMGSGKFKKEPISDNNRYTMQLKWEDVLQEMDKLRLMFSSADSLSKDPSEKLKQLQQLSQAGLIPSSHIGQLLELPDIQTGFNLTSNAINAVSTVISKCIYDDNYEIPAYIPLSMLEEEIINTQLLLQVAQGETDSNQKDIEKLTKLWNITLQMEEELAPPEEEQAAAEVPAETANPEDVTSTVREDTADSAVQPIQSEQIPQN